MTRPGAGTVASPCVQFTRGKAGEQDCHRILFSSPERSPNLRRRLRDRCGSLGTSRVAFRDTWRRRHFHAFPPSEPRRTFLEDKMRLTKSCYAIQRGRRPRRQQSAVAPFRPSESFSSLPSYPSPLFCQTFTSIQFLTDSILDAAVAATVVCCPTHSLHPTLGCPLLSLPALSRAAAIHCESGLQAKFFFPSATTIKEGIVPSLPFSTRNAELL